MRKTIIAGIMLAALTCAGVATTGASAQAAGTVAVQEVSTMPSAKVLPVSTEKQPNGYYCGPSAARNATMGKLNVNKLADLMGTTENGTNSVKEIVRGLNRALGSRVYTAYHANSEESLTRSESQQFRNDMVTAIVKGHGGIVNGIDSWEDTAGETHSFPVGHYIAVIGYVDSGDEFKISDSYDGTEYWMTATQLIDAMGVKGYAA